MRYTFNSTGSRYLGDKDDPIFNQAYAGNAMKVLFSRVFALPTDIDKRNIICRGQNMNWREQFQIMAVLEWDTYFSQESVIGMQDMGSGDVGTIFTLRINDSLPTVRSLPWEGEMIAVQSTGQDHPQAGLVTNAMYGLRFTNLGSGQSVNGLVSYSIGFSYRFRLTGKDWKLANPSAYYPGPVDEVSYRRGGAELPTN